MVAILDSRNLERFQKCCLFCCFQWISAIEYSCFSFCYHDYAAKDLVLPLHCAQRGSLNISQCSPHYVDIININQQLNWKAGDNFFLSKVSQTVIDVKRFRK